MCVRMALEDNFIYFFYVKQKSNYQKSQSLCLNIIKIQYISAAAFKLFLL